MEVHMIKTKTFFTRKSKCGIIVILLCILYASIMSFKSAPITEGWYTEYAWKINHGYLPYKDFEYLFFPLYLYIIAGFTKIFGYSIFALRVLGVFVFSAIGCTLYAIYTKLFNEYVGIVVSFVSVLFMQSENAQIFYDYIRFHDLFAMLTTLSLLYLTDQIVQNKKHNIISFKLSMIIDIWGIVVCSLSIIYFGVGKKVVLFALISCGIIFVLFIKKRLGSYSLLSFLTGFFVAFEFLIKQSNGSIMILFILAFMIIAFFISKDKCFIKELLGIISGLTFVVSALIFYLIVTKSYQECITCCFANAISAKGGLFKTLFIWIPQCFFIFQNKLYIVAIILIIIEILLNKWKDKKSVDRRNCSFIILLISFIGLISIILLNTLSNTIYEYNSQLYDSTIAHISFFIILGIFIFLVIDVFASKKDYYKIVDTDSYKFLLIPVVGVSLAQGYGCAMSGGLATGNTYLCLGLLIGIMLWLAFECKTIIMEIIICMSIVTMSSSFISCKANQMYDWWYLVSGSIDDQTQTTNVPLLNKIKMSVKDKNCYEIVYSDIMNNTKEGDHIYVFPNAPIFYTISNRHSLTYSQVEWFDVSSEYAIVRDIQTLRQNNPKMIVYVSLPEAVYKMHENRFNSYQTRKMSNFLLNELLPNGYILVNSVEIGEDYNVQTYVLSN